MQDRRNALTVLAIATGIVIAAAPAQAGAWVVDARSAGECGFRIERACAELLYRHQGDGIEWVIAVSSSLVGAYAQPVDDVSCGHFVCCSPCRFI